MKKIILTLTAIGIIFSSCKKDKVIATDITINFTQTLDGSDLITDSIVYTNEAGEDYDIQTLKYIISDITLHTENGSNLQLDEIHFIDIYDPSTFSFTYNALPNNNYTSISFDMGLDSTKNISNKYINEDFHPSMFWPAPNGGGYHYMKLEGAYNNDSTFYNTHTGGTMGGDYSFKNTKTVYLKVDDNLGNISININMEINNWYQTPNEIEFSNYGMGIMMNMMMQMDIQMNGRTDVFTITVDK